MTDTVRYVNTASTGGDGTTNEVTGGTAAYASLTSWESNEDGVIGATDRHICHVTAESGSEDDSYLNINGWTVSGELIIQKHASATDAILKPGTGSGHAIHIQEDNVTIDGLEIDMTSMDGSSEEGIRVDGDDCVIKNCKIHSGTTSQMDAIYFIYGDTSTLTCTIENCMIWDIERGGIHCQASDNKTIYVANCTLWDVNGADSSDYPVVGFYIPETSVSSTMRVINTAVHKSSGSSTDCYGDRATNGTFTANSDYNVSSDTTAETEFGATNSHNSVTFQAGTGGSGDRAMFISLTAGSEDLHAEDDANNFLKDSGAGPSHGTLGSFVPTTDIDGDSRSGSDCWIGADEISGASGVEVSLTGQSSTSSFGTLSIAGDADIALTGHSSTSGLGTLTSTGAANINLAGLFSTCSPGTLTVSGGAEFTLTGQSATGAHGTLSVSVGGGDTEVSLTGISATSGLGTLTVATDAVMALTGQSATGEEGTVTAGAGASAALTGQSSTAGLGTLGVTGHANQVLTGIAATGDYGTLTISAGDIEIAITGIDATGQVGSIAITGSATINLSGLSATGQQGVVAVITGEEGQVIGSVTISFAVGGDTTITPATGGNITLN